MNLWHKITGRVRGENAMTSFENREDEQCLLSSCGDTLYGQALPELTELVRLNDSWQMLSSAFTGFTGVPTTSAAFAIRNNERTDGKIYLIHSVCVFRPIVDVTTNDQFSVFGQVARPNGSGGVADAFAAKGFTGNKYGGQAVANVVISMTSGRWDFLGTSPSNATAIAGTAWTCVDIPLYGRYVIVPGSVFGVHVSEVTATASAFRVCVRWHEVLLPYVT